MKENLQYALPGLCPVSRPLPLSRLRASVRAGCAVLEALAAGELEPIPPWPAMQGSMKQQRRSGFGNTNSPDFWARCPAAAGGISMRCARRNRL